MAAERVRVLAPALVIAPLARMPEIVATESTVKVRLKPSRLMPPARVTRPELVTLPSVTSPFIVMLLPRERAAAPSLERRPAVMSR